MSVYATSKKKNIRTASLVSMCVWLLHTNVIVLSCGGEGLEGVQGMECPE